MMVFPQEEEEEEEEEMLVVVGVVHLVSILIQKGQRALNHGADGSEDTTKMVEAMPRRCPTKSLVNTLTHSYIFIFHCKWWVTIA